MDGKLKLTRMLCSPQVFCRDEILHWAIQEEFCIQIVHSGKARAWVCGSGDTRLLMSHTGLAEKLHRGERR